MCEVLRTLSWHSCWQSHVANSITSASSNKSRCTNAGTGLILNSQDQHASAILHADQSTEDSQRTTKRTSMTFACIKALFRMPAAGLNATSLEPGGMFYACTTCIKIRCFDPYLTDRQIYTCISSSMSCIAGTPVPKWISSLIPDR